MKMEIVSLIIYRKSIIFLKKKFFLIQSYSKFKYQILGWTSYLWSKA